MIHDRTVLINEARTSRRFVVYTTEVGLENYVHLYGPNLKDDVRATRTNPAQRTWLEPIRMAGKGVYEQRGGTIRVRCFTPLARRAWQKQVEEKAL